MTTLTKKEKNNVLAQAWIDYDPTIVKINEKAITELRFYGEKQVVLSNNENEALKNKSIKEAVQYLIGLNSINYQFWDVQDSNFTRYKNNGFVGALAMYDGFEKLYNFLKTVNFNTAYISTEKMKEYFGDIPELDERISILKESFNKGSFDMVFEIIESNAKNGVIDVETANQIAKVMPIAFDDPYLKKIQLTLFEIAEVLNKNGYTVTTDLTVAADYQIPRILEHRGVLEYNNELSKRIDNQELIEADSKEEKALRAATIIACNEIADYHNVSVPVLDRILWIARNESKKPFHLTKTPRY